VGGSQQPCDCQHLSRALKRVRLVLQAIERMFERDWQRAIGKDKFAQMLAREAKAMLGELAPARRPRCSSDSASGRLQSHGGCPLALGACCWTRTRHLTWAEFWYPKL
jgi:hypothetical protein